MRSPSYALLLALAAALPAHGDTLFRKAAMATAYPDATRAGLLMLQKGGNAVDAAVAAAFVAGVAGPYHNGVGGGGFALVYDARSRRTKALDFREVAPGKASRDMYQRSGQPVPALSRDGGSSVAVPGAVAGYLALLRRYGRLPAAVVLQPAIALAQRGIWVTPKYQQMAQLRLDCLREHPDAARLYLRPGASGQPDVPELGTLLPNPALARTLRRIAAQGEDGFYRGAVARVLAQSAQEAGGVLSEADLAGYRVRWHEPLWGHFRGYPIATMPPPSGGGITVLQVLGQLERRTGRFVPGDVESEHLLIEAMRRAYLDRAKFGGDPAFVPVPTAELISDQHLAQLAGSIDPAHATPSRALLGQLGGPQGYDAGHQTTHLSVVDAQGNAVSMTTTINYAFGSCVVASGTGVLLNDEMDDFAAKPLTPNVYGLVTGEANAIAPGKVPLSSMSPTLVFQKDHPERLLLALGAPGGPTIPTTVAQVLLNVLDGGLDLERAVAAGRLHEQLLPDNVLLEAATLQPLTRSALESMGHHFQPIDVLGDAEAVEVDPSSGLREAASDPRGEGQPLGQD